MPGDEEIAQRLRALGRPVILAVNKTDDKRARSRALEFYSWASSRCSKWRPSTATASPSCSTRSSRACPPRGRTRAAAPSRRDRGRHRRPAERREVVARQPAAARRARDGQRDAGHDARHRGRAAAVAQAPVPARRHRRHAPARPGRGGRAGRSGERRAGQARDGARRRRRAGRRCRPRAPAIAKAPSPAKPRRPAAASSSPSTSGTWCAGQGQEWVKDVRRQAAVPAQVPRIRADRPPLGADRASARRSCSRSSIAWRRARKQRVPTSELNRFLEAVTAAHPPTSKTRREVRILYGAQTGIAPPAFVLFTNVATELHFSYERFLVNRLREAFGFEGTPIRLKVRRRDAESRAPDGGAEKLGGRLGERPSDRLRASVCYTSRRLMCRDGRHSQSAGVSRAGSLRPR